MNVTSELRIDEWSVDHDTGWLRVTVKGLPLGDDEDYYRVPIGNGDGDPIRRWVTTVKRSWVWRGWSMAGKPSIRADKYAELLDALVLEHPVLSLIASEFGYLFSLGEACVETIQHDPRHQPV